MRFMTWCLGVLLLVSWHASDKVHGAPPGWSYMGAWAFWFVVGLSALTVAIVRVVSSKLKSGTLSMPGARHPGPLDIGKDD